MTAQTEKYENLMRMINLEEKYPDKIGIDKLKVYIMRMFGIKENYLFKFHIQNMELLGMIKQSEVVGVFEIPEKL